MKDSISIIINALEEDNISLLHRTIKSILIANQTMPLNQKAEIICIIKKDKNDIANYLNKFDFRVLGITSDNIELAKPNVFKDINTRYISIINSGDLISKNWIKCFLNTANNTENKDAVLLHPEYILFFQHEAFLFKNKQFDELNKEYSAQFTKSTSLFDLPCVFSKALLSESTTPIVPVISSKTLYFARKEKNNPIEKYVYFSIAKVSNNQLFKENINKFIESNKNKRIACYGGGKFAQDLFTSEGFENYNNIIGFIDRNIIKAGQKIGSYTIFHLDNFKALNPDILLLTTLYPEVILPDISKFMLKNNITCSCQSVLSRNFASIIDDFSAPEWLKSEIKEINVTEPALYPELHKYYNQKQSAGLYSIPTGYIDNAYHEIKKITKNSYDYAILVPWLVRGGAELETLNYINALTELNPMTKILVISTNSTKESPWKEKLPFTCDFLELGKLYSEYPLKTQTAILSSLLSKLKPKIIHNINSDMGYKLFRFYGKELKTFAKLFDCQFCILLSEEGKLVGNPFFDLTECIQYIEKIFIDNQKFIDTLVDMFGFDKNKFAVHYHPIHSDHKKTEAKSNKDTLNILWAARMDKQKQPNVLYEIAKKCAGKPYKFHVWGYSVNDDYDVTYKFDKLDNIKYHGPYDQLYSLPINDYDAYLYTSMWDGLPNVLLEAISCKLPIIATDVGGISELVEHGKSGFLVRDISNPDEYIEYLDKLYEDQTLIEQFTNNASEKIKTQHSWDSFIKTLKNHPDYLLSTGQ